MSRSSTSSPAGARAPGRRWVGAAAAVVPLLAAALSATAGRRGLFAFDQSILFDAGHRILSGQTPFEDFVLPFGPVAPVLQAAAFALFGTDWAGYLAAAALGNAVASGLGMLLLARLLPDRPALWLLGGVLTALWFYPPSGTPWFDQTAFLWVLGAAVSLLPSVLGSLPPAGSDAGSETGSGTDAGGRPRTGPLAWAAVAGACAVLAFLTKQNAGVAALPLFALLLAVPLLDHRGPRTAPLHRVAPALAFLGGATTGALLFAAWLGAAAEPGLFVRHVLEIPAGEGARRLLDSPLVVVAFHLVGIGPPAARLALGLSAAAGAAAGVAAQVGAGVGAGLGGRGVLGDRRAAAGAAAVGGLFLAQHLFNATSYNQPEIAAPFTGLVPPLAAGLVLGWSDRRRGGRGAAGGGSLRWATVTALAGVSLLLAGTGWRATFDRTAQDLFPPRARFDRPVAVGGLESLLWGRPTVLDNPAAGTSPGATVAAADLEALVAALEDRPGPVFVFPDWTLLYGLLDRPAPQPLLWFHEGLTYPMGGDPELDRWIVERLERAGLRTVVLERTSWFGTAQRLADFPRLAEYLERCFAPERRIGIFELRSRRRPECPPTD